MRIRSQRLILFTPFATPPNPGGIIIPDPISTTKRVRTSRDIIWDMEDDSEVTGTVGINRSILWDVQEAGGPELVNYVEVPFRHNVMWRADPGNPGYPYAIQFTGIVKIWESGTLQFVGEGVAYPHSGAPAPTISELSYKVWSGGSPGQLHTVFTLPVDSNYYAVNWSDKVAPGEHWEICYGAIPEAIGTNASFEMIEYPAGLVLPIDLWGGAASPIAGHTGTTLVRNADSIDGSYAVIGAAFTSGHTIYSWQLDSSDFSLSNPILHLFQSTLFPSSFNGTFTREIPDSSTIGLWMQVQTAYSPSDQIAETFEVGPFFRLAYAPTIQQGVDPIP